jgi:hypothetical protein
MNIIPNHPHTAAAIQQFAFYASTHGCLNPQQEKFHVAVDRLVTEGDLYKLVRYVDNGIPELSKDRKRGVLTKVSARWIRQWRFNVQMLILDQVAIEERAAA